MAISDALAWRLNSGGTADDLYSDIRTFLGTNPDAAATQAAMRQYGISGEDVAAATGGASGGLLSGNILAGASWNSSNTALQNQLTEATGQATSNYAVAGSTTTDTLNQLNTYLAGGGQFDPNATVYLQAGGVDFITGVDKAVVKDNLNQIVKTLGDQGVNVVLTGSPYAASVQDVIDNKFDPKVDQIYNDVAKANSNVALVGTQGEILQNKALLVDALHTNAEGTAVYNQSVIDALSQFKNEVPSSTPQAIAQVYQSNTVPVTAPVITQAAASPVVAQALATQSVDTLIKAGNLNPTQIAKQTGLSEGEITSRIGATLPPNQAALFGDTYVQAVNRVTGSGEDEQVGALENVITYKASENQAGGSYQQYTPTGELERTGTQQKVAGSFLGGLAEAFNDPVVQAAFLGLGGGGALGNALGLTGSTAQAVGTGLFKGGTAAAGGADLGEALKVGLLSGGLVYGGNALNNYLTTGTTAEPSITERQFAIADAKNLASQGLSTTQIADTLAAGGYNEAIIDRAITSLTGSTASTLPTPGAVNVTGTATTAIPAGGLLSSLVVPKTTLTTPTASTATTTPVTQAGTVNVTGTAQPQMVDQTTLNLIASQLASNVATPANLGTSTNLANVEITANRPATTTEIANAILATVPNVTLQQAQTQAQVLITSGQNLTTNDLISAVSSVSPNITNSVAEQIITSTNSTVIPSIVNSLASVAASTIPASSIPTSTIPTQTITAPRPSTITSDLTTAAIPLIQPSTPLTLPEIPRQPTTPTASNPLLNTAGTLGLSSLLSGLPNLISGGLGTAGNLLQMQTSREAAQRAQAMIDAETKAAKDAAQFRPIGMTTRFGTSQFGFDPVTGRLSSAGYTLTPDVKAQQDRFMALSNQGLTQAEQAQAQFAPLQTGATSLFTLGNKYLAQSPQDVAQNYLAQQMALLQPGRELEFANLQTKLRNQGRQGLSVAQGGDLGATTPELQALYNARARQEAELAANAQQAGQRDVLFGAGLLGQGSQAMGQYYGGQQAAYAPYTAAMGQAQTLETLGQQPYNMGVNLGQIGSQAGFNVGQLGLKGAQLSAGLATSADATRNLLAQGLTAAGNPNAMIGQSLSGLFGGGLQSAFSGTGLGSSGFGTGLAYGNQDLGLFL
jgi:hypothetical protein